jgi:nitrogen regulatory protein P-II 2
MKLITVIIKPFKLDEVHEALIALDVQGMTVTDVRGYGRQRGSNDLYPACCVDFIPKLKIEVAISDDKLDQVLEAIATAALTGKIGDGKIFVQDLESVVRIRTRESGESAL